MNRRERLFALATVVTAFLLISVPVTLCGLSLRALDQGLFEVRWTATGGLISPLAGSLWVALGAMAWAGPVGVGGAFWLRWLAPRRWRRTLRRLVRASAALPPVVVAFVGLTLVPPTLAALVGASDGRGAAAAILVLGFLALPAISTAADRAMRRVSRGRLDAALALGATREQALREVVWPRARPGVLAAVLFGVGRALGDTMVVLMVAGEAAGTSVLGPVRTLTATIAADLPGASAEHRAALYGLAAALVVLTSFTAIAARRVDVVDV